MTTDCLPTFVRSTCISKCVSAIKPYFFIQDKADTDVQETKKMYDSVLETEDTFVKVGTSDIL